MVVSRIFHVGFDDTDSSDGMCTTFLCYTAVKQLVRKKKVDLLDYPHLIRLNPNIPWKTRGNAALSIRLKTTIEREALFDFFKAILMRYATSPRANSGLVIYEGCEVPEEVELFSTRALYEVMSLREARNIAEKYEMDTFELRRGQGLVGALSSIGNQLRKDRTFELISYRQDLRKKREIDPVKIKIMSALTFPETFSSYDRDHDRIMIMPHGPDPVLCGIRGETAGAVLRAFRSLYPIGNFAGYMIFKSNQGTGEHLDHEINLAEAVPYSSGSVIGKVISKPEVQEGGHLFFGIANSDGEISCACYEPTAEFRKVVGALVNGDLVQVGGGIRKPTSLHEKVLNMEFLRPIKLVPLEKFYSVKCPDCGVSLKSKGRGQGFSCEKCGFAKKENAKNRVRIERGIIPDQLYIPPVKAHRHLTKPLHRYSLPLKETDPQVGLVEDWFE